MNFKELVGGSIKKDLVQDIESMDLSSCSSQELIFLRTWAEEEKANADFLTLEDEIVGYIYNNLDVLMPKIEHEEQNRTIQLVKVRQSSKLMAVNN